MYKIYFKKMSSKDLLNFVMKDNNINSEIIYNKYGKPYFKDSKYFFNISNCNNYSALVLSDKEIGIDLQCITKIDNRINKVINKVCNNEEKVLINNDLEFTVMWVKKESYVKYLGIGLEYGLENVNTLDKKYKLFKFNDYILCIYFE